MDDPRLLSLSISSEQFQELEGRAASTTGPARRSIRKNVVARGLARRYDDQKGREEALKARISRQAKQLAILEEYNRRKDANHGGSTATLSNGPTSSATRGILPQKGLTHFPRNTSLRVLADNQREEREDGVDDEELSYPTEEDLERFVALTSKANPSDIARVPSPVKAAAINTSSQQTGSGSDTSSVSKRGGEQSRGSSIDKSSAQVLCELRATKEIVIREQTLKQLRQLVPVIDKLASEVSHVTQKKASAASLLVAATSSPLREKRGSSSLTVVPLSTRRPESGQTSIAAAEREVKELSVQFSELADKLTHRMKQFRVLVEALQESSMVAADAIIEWRHFRTRRCRLTNFQPLYRFPWRKMRVLNYLTHMDQDVQFLFDTAALQVVVGAELAYNPLLLPRHQLESLGFAESSFVSTTFLTERWTHDGGDAVSCGSSPPTRSSDPPRKRPLHELEQQYEALLAALTSGSGGLIHSLVLDSDRARRCLEIIHKEKELESAEAEKVECEQQRVAEAYNPFASIKAVGGVEETLTQLLASQSPHAAALLQQLRHRQEDTTRAAGSSSAVSSADGREAPSKLVREPTEQLRVNSRRLRMILEKRKELEISTTECEARSIQTWGKKNKLPGKLVVRKMAVKRQQNQSARKIQLQYRAHRFRSNVLHHLTAFITKTRQSAIQIQRIFRGHCAKKNYDISKMLLDAERRRVDSGRKIWHAYRRFKRRLRHRRSMTVESIAQAQLFNIQYQKLQEDSEEAVDRYRRVGEERRRQRVVLLQKRKLEQLELEYRRSVAAIKIQALVRGHLAKCELASLRKEKKSHLTAVSIMALQSNVRRFLKRQEARRLRFRQDLERVNRSAVRIQSIYRGYNSRASLLFQLDETLKDSLEYSSQRRTPSVMQAEVEEEDEEDEEQEEEEDPNADRLPPIDSRFSRPASSCDNDETTHDGLHTMIAMLSSPLSSSPSRANPDTATRLVLPPLRPSVAVPSTPTARRPSFTRQLSAPHVAQAMTRVELKLKEPQIGDDFQSRASARRDSMELRRGSRGLPDPRK